MLPKTSQTNLLAILVLAVLAAYANAISGKFQYDDYHVIVYNPAVHSFGAWWNGMPGIRPLLKLSYSINWTTGFGATGFIAVNVVLHLVNTILVFAILCRLAPQLGITGESISRIAFAAALLFALHPAQTEAVTYISGRSVSLMATFTLASLLAYLKAQDGMPAWRIFSALLFVAALAAKENAWVLPLALLLCEALHREFSWRSFFMHSAAHSLVLIGLGLVVLLIPDYGRLLLGSLQIRTTSDNLLTQVDGLFYLITRPLLALNLNIDPDLPVQQTLTVVLATKALALVATVAIALRQWRKFPGMRWAFGVLWFFVWLIPTNSILPRTDIANDRQLYLALLGPALTVAMLLLKLPAHRHVLIATLLLGLGTATMLRNHDYRSEVALWEATAKRSPDKARVWNNLGYALQQAGDIPAARLAYRQALWLDPDYWLAKNNLDLLK